MTTLISSIHENLKLMMLVSVTEGERKSGRVSRASEIEDEYMRRPFQDAFPTHDETDFESS